MIEEKFAPRLTALRMKKGTSARDMSLSIGQNQGYINDIESGKSLPSMAVFFIICDYLGISPKAFFDLDCAYPDKIKTIVDGLQKLDEQQVDNIASIVEGLSKSL